MSIVIHLKKTVLLPSLTSLMVLFGCSQSMVKGFNNQINPPTGDLVATSSTPVAAEFQEILPKIKQQTQIPILLPSKLLITGTDNKIHVDGKGTSNGYEITLAFAPNCTGNACSIGYINAEKGGKPLEDEFSRQVSLVRDIKGYFRPLTCGASCAPPVIGWEYEGVFYRMAFKGVGQTPEMEGETLAKMANSAIEAGAR